MNALNPNTTVGELVTEKPGRSRVLEKLGIDYCCGGNKPLGEACREKGLNPDNVIAELESSDQAPGVADNLDFNAMPLTELVDHIVNTHHAYLKKELPRLSGIIRKVVDTHGDRNPALSDLLAVFNDFAAELQSHWTKEERILFPAIKELAKPNATEFSFGDIGHPIRVMEAEHETAGAALEQIRELTDNFTTPDWGCNTYRAMVDALAELESDTHLHIHKENNILFPKAIALQEKLA
ncbi:MAG: iron-sulfur cluster repair di-iron protein [Candidatus Zixiibacteriota bacterium]|jgi:regulator of cell morphogenesis and NO signaling